MTRVALYLVGSVVMLTLAGCGRSWMSFEQRDPWRREAELACLKSGAVKQTATIVQVKPIEGPGQCGADYPFKVVALGDMAALGFAGEMRPPGAVGRGFPIPEPRQSAAADREPAMSTAYGSQRSYGGAGERPLTLQPSVESEPEEEDTSELDLPGAGGAPRTYGGGQPPQQSYERRPQFDAGAAPVMSYAAGPTNIQPAATLACPMVSALDGWMAQSVQPAAQRWFGQPVAEIRQISAYSCRGMNGQRGAPISEHAFGNALDIAAFTLADGTKVTVKNGWRGSPEEQGFLRDVHASACQQFNTVLAPGSNVFHYDHIHVDLARRRSGRQVCNPAAIPGDVVAQRARDRIANAGGGRERLGFAPEPAVSEIFDVKLPRAVPGED